MTVDRAWSAAGEETLQDTHQSLSDAWELEFAPALSDGKIKGSGSKVSCGVLATIERREVGLTFPPSEKPMEADGFELSHHAPEPALRPKGSIIAHTWIEWRDLIFPASRVQELWPVPGDQAADNIKLIAQALLDRQAEVERDAAAVEPVAASTDPQGQDQAGTFRNTPSIDLAHDAIAALFPDGVPRGMRASERNKKNPGLVWRPQARTKRQQH